MSSPPDDFTVQPMVKVGSDAPLPSTPPLPSPWPQLRLDALAVLDSDHRASAYATLASYYHAVFALIRGDTRRPPLPLELIIHIVRLAGLASPYPSRELSVLLMWKPCPATWICGTGLMRQPVVLVPFLKTAPLPKDALRAISKIEVVVNFLQNTEYKASDLSAILGTKRGHWIG